MAPGVRGENKPIRGGKTVRKSRGEAEVEAVLGSGGVVCGWEPRLEASAATNGGGGGR